MRGLALLILVVGMALVLLAQQTSAQQVLAENWRDLGPRERYDAMQNYWRHERLPRSRQQDIEQHYKRWQGMSPEQRNRIKENYERLRKLPPKEQQRFQRKYRKWRDEQGASPHR